MDPSTQRMLERARARRQKLDQQLKNTGQEASQNRVPLQESNTQFVKVTTEVEVVLNTSDNVKKVNVSPTKVEVTSAGEKENEVLGSPRRCQLDMPAKDSDRNVERNVRSQLKRLGALYSDDAQISSPIHRTENKFNLETDDVVKTTQPSARVARLAALADNIKQWEDDLSHPNISSKDIGLTTVSDTTYNREQEKRPETTNQFPHMSVKNKQEYEPGERYLLHNVPNTTKKVEHFKTANSNEKFSSHFIANNQGDKSGKLGKASTKQVEQSNSALNTDNIPKKIIWDEKVLQLLEAQGFSRSVSDCRLLYDYSKPSSQDDVNETSASKPNGSPKVASNAFARKNEVVNSTERKEVTEYQFSIHSKISGGSPVRNTCLEKIVQDISPNKSVFKSSPAKGSCSPRKLPPASPKAGSVLEKASMFESCSPKKVTKDPAELPLSERLALFERNKGQALIPKAAFSMPVPAKYLGNDLKKQGNSPEKTNVLRTNPNEKSCTGISEPNVSSKVFFCREVFEKGIMNEAKDRIVSEQSSRQYELEMLRNRWNVNKSLASETPGPVKMDPPMETRQKYVPAPPPLPEESNMSPVRNNFALPQITQMVPKNFESEQNSPTKNVSQLSPKKPLHESPKINKISDVFKVKKIKISPPKPGHLYPCLSDIEVTTEAESEIADDTERDSDSSIASDSDDGNTSFGREILEAAGINRRCIVPENQHTDSMNSSNSELSESAVLADIDGCIDEALVGYDSSSESENDGPTPPKKSREYHHSPQRGKQITHISPHSKTSQSFKYTPGNSMNVSSSHKSPERNHECDIPASVVDGDKEMSLMHSVSFYRKQQNMVLKNTPVRQIVRPPETVVKMETQPIPQVNEEEAVRNKITDLLEEVSKQQIVISQASQALNLCMATVEFSASAEQVEGERLLLLATHKRQAALHEVQRLKVEGTLKPTSEAGASASFNKGSLLLTNIILTLKKDYIRRLPSEDTCYHFVCLIRSQNQVLGTQVLAASCENLKDGCNLMWNSPLRLVNLYSDFKVTVEVYSLQTRREMLPHNIKYHIGAKKDTSKSWLTPKKQKHESLLVMPSINSPAGPSAVRSSEFRMAGYVVFSLKEINRTHFTLNKVSYSSPLEGAIQLKVKSELSVDVCEKGFLTMFEDVSGFGAWHRRWFVLRGTTLAYWRYPDDERKIPIGQIDLNSCTTMHVGLVSRDICARPNTFLLETTRPAQPDDKDSLVMITSGDTTIIRVLLSADTKEERIVWCTQINKALSLMRAWGNKQEDV